jgi:hypothetical protein
MTTKTRISCFETLPISYPKVCEALALNADRVFEEATKAATTNANGHEVQLHATIAGIQLNKNVQIEVQSYIEVQSDAEQQLAVELRWEATRVPHWFPTMTARLAVTPISETETKLGLVGEYEPPLGFVGHAINSVFGHHVAETSVQRFLADVVNHLKETLE